MATQHNKQLKSLKDFISKQPYIKMNERAKVCASFGLPHSPSLFQDEYRKRFYNYLLKHPTTVSVVSQATAIPQKYLTQCKAYYEKKNLLRVIGLGRCPSTGTNHVQFVSTDSSLWDNLSKLKSNKNIKTLINH